MNLGIVVTTIGRVQPLEHLLETVLPQLRPGDELVIVAQGERQRIQRVVDRLDRARRVSVVSSERGASRGRNAGVRALPGAGELLLVFPNDTTWFPPGSVEAISELDVHTGGALTIVDESGPKFTLPSPGTPLNRSNVWGIIEMGILMPRGVFDTLGGFDEQLGTGAPSPWQSGEGTDLMLRYLERYGGAGFCWAPPDVWLGGIADPRGLNAIERRRKLRAYARGYGSVLRRWRYPVHWRLGALALGVLFGIRHRREGFRALDGGAVALGRLEGLVGRTFGRDDLQAVNR